MEEKFRAHQSTFDQGRVEALEIAVLTLIKGLPPEHLENFKAGYKLNADMWDAMSLKLPVTEEWRRGLAHGAGKLLDTLSQPAEKE